MRRTRRQTEEIRVKINNLAQSGFTYKEIARMLKLKSHQLVAYHLDEYRAKINKK